MIPQALITTPMVKGTGISKATGLGLKTEKSFKGFLSQIMGNKSANLEKKSGPVHGPASGMALIEKLRQVLSSAKGGLKGLSIDKNSLPILQKFLEGAGFDKGEVTKLIKGLADGGKGTDVKLLDIFAKIGKLDDPQKKAKQSDMADISAIPFIESLLAMIGVSGEKMGEIMGRATVETKGIDLTKLISELKKIDSRSIESPWDWDENKNNRISGMARGIGLGKSQDKASDDSLDRFVQELEKVVSGKSGGYSSKHALASDITEFLGSIKGFGKDIDILKSAEQKKLIKGNALLNGLKVSSQSSGIKNQVLAMLNNELGNTPAKPGTVKFGKYLIDKKEKADLTKAAGFGEKSYKRGSAEIKQEIFSMENHGGISEKNSGVSSARAGKPAAKSLPAYVLNQVSRQILRSINKGESEILLKLKPPHLGSVEISLANLHDSLKVSIMAEHHSARDILVSHSGDLRNALAESGVKLEKIDVQISLNFGQSMANSNQGQGRRSGKKSPVFRLDGDIHGRDGPLVNALPESTGSGTGLHLVA